MFAEGIVGVSRLNDGDTTSLRLGTQGEVLFSEVGAKYAYHTMRGKGFVFATTSAISVTALGNTLPTLFNPLGSGVITILTKVTIQAAAIGTPAVSGFQYGALSNAGAQVSTAGPILTGTAVAGVCTNINLKATPQTLFFPAVCSFTAAPSLLAPVGVNLGSTATQTPWTGVDDVDGRIILTPGSALQIGASTTTSTTFNIAFWAYEVVAPQLA